MPGQKIMIVDDDIEFMEEINEVLLSEGYVPILVNDGKIAIDIVKSSNPRSNTSGPQAERRYRV